MSRLYIIMTLVFASIHINAVCDRNEQQRHELWHTICGLRRYLHEIHQSHKVPSQHTMHLITHDDPATVVGMCAKIIQTECQYIHAENHGWYPMHTHDIDIPELQYIYRHPYESFRLYSNLSPMRTMNALHAYKNRRTYKCIPRCTHKKSHETVHTGRNTTNNQQ